MATRCVAREGRGLPIHMSKDLPHVCFVAPHVFPVLSGNEHSQLIGGAEVQQSIIARGLAERGFAISIVCLDFGQDATVDINGIRVLRAFRLDAGVPIIRFLYPRATSLWSCMKRANADIYYQRTAGMITGLVAAFCRHYGRKAIFAASGNPNFERNTKRIHYRRDRWLYEYGLMRVDRIFAQNAEQAELCWRNFGRHSTVVPNGYELPTTSRSAPGREIIWVGTIRSLKRPDVFLDVAAALPQYRFRMIGGPEMGDKGMFESIKARADSMSNVTFMGFVPYSQVDEYFDNAAVLLNTSDSEGFPNTFLQAWSRAIVTVSFVDCGARREGMPVGRIVSSVDQMIASISALMEDKVLRRQEGRWCNEYVERNHSLGQILDLYQKIFTELAGS